MSVEVSDQRGPGRPNQQHETQIAVHSVNSASSAKEPRSGKDPRRPTASMAELALMARVRKGNRKTCDRETAEEALIWALEVATCGPTGLMERRPYLKLGPVCRGFVALAVASIAVFLLLTMARVGFREVSTRDGLLLAAGVPAYKGEEPVAAVAAPFEQRALRSCQSLPSTDLRRIRDIVIINQGSWLNIRVTHVQKFSDHHIWLQAADGTAVRVLGGQLIFRDGALGDEVQLESETDQAMAYFEVVVPGATS